MLSRLASAALALFMLGGLVQAEVSPAPALKVPLAPRVVFLGLAAPGERVVAVGERGVVIREVALRLRIAVRDDHDRARESEQGDEHQGQRVLRFSPVGDENRGTIMSVYIGVNFAAITLGQFMVTLDAQLLLDDVADLAVGGPGAGAGGASPAR